MVGAVGVGVGVGWGCSGGLCCLEKFVKKEDREDWWMKMEERKG